MRAAPEKTNSSEKVSEKAPLRPINNVALAAMLRESADIVERGQFDAVLYTALQDFRAYYKLNYPKKKERSTGSSHNKRRSSKAPAEETKNETTEPPSLSRESSAATSRPPPTVPEAVRFDESRDNSVISQDVFEEEIMSEKSKTPIVTNEETAKDAPVAADPPAAGATTESVESGTGTASNPIRISTSEAEGSQPDPSAPMTSPSSPSKKGTHPNLFGKLKFPKVNVHLPNPPAFAPLSRKHADKTKEDLDAFNGPMAPQAEASQRRSAADRPVKEGWECQTQQSTPKTNHDSAFEPLVPEQEQTQARRPDSNTLNEGTSDHHPRVTPSEASQTTNKTANPVSSANNTSSNSTADSAAAVKSDPVTATASSTVSKNPFDHHTPDNMTNVDSGVPTSSKPDFQRPLNQASSLVANGWIEQLRRSKMRSVWKEVLASLVQARKPGEETTLWIQREIVNPLTGKKELEALHQIPVKLLQQCTYLDYTPDNRFTLKLYNAQDEFVFRCRTDVGSMNWVMALQKQEKIAKNGHGPAIQQPKQQQQQQQQQQPNPAESAPASQPRLTVSELRAICHGAGINTAGMERSQLEATAAEIQKRGTYFPPAGSAPAAPTVPDAKPVHKPTEPKPTQNSVPPAPTSNGTSASISELRAICHGAGINTAGMERGELEAAAERVRRQGTYFAPPPGSHTVPPAPTSGGAPPPAAPQANSNPSKKDTGLSIKDLRAICHGAGISTAGMERPELEAAAEEVRKRGTYFEAPQRPAPTAPSDDSSAKRQEAEEKIRLAKEEYARQKAEEEKRRMAEDEHRRRMAEEDQRRKQAEEEHRRRAAEQQAAEQRRRQAEEEHRRRLAEQEHQRRMAEQHAAEQQRRFAEQQAQWQKQQAEEESRRRMAEQQAAEQRRRHEEAVRQQQQWHQAQNQHQQQHQQQQWPPRQPQPPQGQQHWHQQQQQQQHHTRSATPPHQGHPQHAHHQQQQQQQQHPHHSAASEKYAKMANQTEDDGQAIITRIKHDILIHWALQPPHLQMLRPIDALVLNIHSVFPPALGVPAHDYFKKWKPVSRGDVFNDAGLPEEEKLKKVVRKIRFFLHPDKLPKDLNNEQAFMVKMLWDVTSDAWEEFENRKNDLDWIK
eukprot:Nitzschia sp. Nitz4//scaffold1_size375055//165457//168828//NITZ4_000267-RA/size375055-processed-gene-0.437-mRNA-1//-1//CDS//3329541018//6218//frame0